MYDTSSFSIIYRKQFEAISQKKSIMMAESYLNEVEEVSVNFEY